MHMNHEHEKAHENVYNEKSMSDFKYFFHDQTALLQASNLVLNLSIWNLDLFLFPWQNSYWYRIFVLNFFQELCPQRGDLRVIFLFWMSLNKMMTSSAGEKGSWLHIAFRQSIAQSMSEAEQVLSNGLYPFNAIKKTEFRVVNSFQVISRKLQYFNDWPEIIFHILFERDKMIKMIKARLKI